MDFTSYIVNRGTYPTTGEQPRSLKMDSLVYRVTASRDDEVFANGVVPALHPAGAADRFFDCLQKDGHRGVVTITVWEGAKYADHITVNLGR